MREEVDEGQIPKWNALRPGRHDGGRAVGGRPYREQERVDDKRREEV